VKHDARILAVDAGNSRVKWALHENSGFVKESACARDSLDILDREWADLAQPDVIVVANVAGDVIGARLAQACARWERSPIWVKGQTRQCGVINGYADPGQLGPDRWAALIGANALSLGNCTVVCMGTATTIDALTDKGDFLGGMILPGIELMHVLLNENTARLGHERGETVSFPRSTPDAITSGAIRATCGAIEYMHNEMQRAGHGDVSIIVTGGAAPTFVGLYERPVVLHNRLVLEGLVCIGKSGRE
jgi:type III pantothenate kinase